MDLHARAERPNLFIKIPGTREGLPAIEQPIFAGVPINVTLLFSAEQYSAAAEAYLRGIERRINAGLDPKIDLRGFGVHQPLGRAAVGQGPGELATCLGLRSPGAPTRSYWELLDLTALASGLFNAGARPQRLLLGQHRHQGPKPRTCCTSRAWLRPYTVNTMPENTLKAFADHGKVGDEIRADGGDGEAVLAEYTKAGVDFRPWRQSCRRTARILSSLRGTV